jgi:hypothetical protein
MRPIVWSTLVQEHLPLAQIITFPAYLAVGVPHPAAMIIRNLAAI